MDIFILLIQRNLLLEYDLLVFKYLLYEHQVFYYNFLPATLAGK